MAHVYIANRHVFSLHLIPFYRHTRKVFGPECLIGHPLLSLALVYTGNDLWGALMVDRGISEK